MTAEEYNAVQPFQRVRVFTSPDEAHLKVGIAIVGLADDGLRKVRCRHRETIDRHLDAQ